MHNDILHEIIILLAASVVVIAIVRRLHLPPLLGYLFVGMLAGPSGMGWIESMEDTHFLAEFGVVFLLFTIGLEFSLPKLVAMRTTVLGLGSLQVFTTGLVGFVIALLFGLSWEGAFVIGSVMALSSTAIVSKQLAEQLEINTLHGKTAIGVLLFQDLAVVPLLVIIPLLAGHSNENIGMQLFWALGKAALVFMALLAMGRWILRPFFHQIASTRSAELFTLSVLLSAIAAAWVTHEAGLSLALGAFLAGMVLGETQYRHQIEADIRPFQDVLLGLFFITVGMLIDLSTLPDLWLYILLTTVALLTIKTAIIVLLGIRLKHDTKTSIRSGLLLSQGGEFGFALLSIALTGHLIPETAAQISLGAILLSMAISSVVIRYNDNVATWISHGLLKKQRDALEQEIQTAAESLNKHVILCGYGRVGQHLARFLEKENISFIAVDLDPMRVAEATIAGDPVHYGDSTHLNILQAAGIDRAHMVVVAYDSPKSAFKILHHARKTKPALPVLIRTRDETHLEELQQAGATEVVPDTLEASLMLGSHLLLLLGTPPQRVLRYLREIRGDRYKLLRPVFHGEDSLNLEDSPTARVGLHSVYIPKHAYAVGKTLESLQIKENNLVTTAIRRHGIKGEMPVPEMVVQAEDIIVLYGAPEDIERCEKHLLEG